MPTKTQRLFLDRPRSEDADGLHQICSDPRVWSHFPSLRHGDIEQTQVMVSRFISAWHRAELGPWVVKNPSDQSIIGYGGCSIKDDIFWNLGYRFAFDAQGQGFATSKLYQKNLLPKSPHLVCQRLFRHQELPE